MAHKSVRGFLQLIGTNVVTKACWALILILLLRKLGATSFGVLATLWSGAAIAAGFTDLGTSQALLRAGSRDHASARRLAGHSLRVQAIVTAATIVLLAVGFWAILPIGRFPPWQRDWVIVLGVAAPLIDRFQALFTVCSQIGGNYSIYSKVRSGYFICLLLLLAGVLWSEGGLLAVSAAYFGLTVVFAALMGTGTWGLLPSATIAAHTSPVKALLWQGLPFLLITTLTLAYGRIEVTILGLFGHTATAGSYHVMYQLVLLVYSIAGMFFTITYPRLYGHRGDPTALVDDFRDTVRWLSLLGWSTALPLWLFAQPILHLMGGTELATYAPLLKVLAAMVLLIPASAALNFLLPADMLRIRVGCDVVGIIVTAAIAAWAAIHNLPIWIAGGAVMGYAVAVALSHITLRGTLPGLTRILLAEFAGIGLRMLPGAILAWWAPGNWWLKLTIFIITGAVLLLTHKSIVRRLCIWFSPKT